MSVKETDKIDAIGVEESTNTLVLLVSDPFQWKIQEYEHLKAFQTKINNYVHFIESGQYRTKYPDRSFDSFRIEAVFKYRWSDAGESFFSAGKKQLAERGIDFSYKLKEVQQ